MVKDTSNRTPSFRLHKASKQGYVELHGRRIYLGRYDLPETRQKYHRLIAEWLANGRQLSVDPAEIMVAEVLALFWKHAQGYYVRPDGAPTAQQNVFKEAMKPLRKLYGATSAAAFGPKALRTVRQTWIKKKLARTTINKYTNALKYIFRWATAQELIPGTTYHALAALEGLRRGRSEAREPNPVQSVPESDIAAVRPRVSRQVRALIDLQLLTGARVEVSEALFDTDTEPKLAAQEESVERWNTRNGILAE